MRSYVLYVLRWMALAVPGAWFLVQVQNVIENTYLAMVISQGFTIPTALYRRTWSLLSSMNCYISGMRLTNRVRTLTAGFTTRR